MQKTLFSTALLLGSVSSVWALDTEAFMASLQQMAKTYDLTLNKEKVDTNGTTVIMRGVTLTNAEKSRTSLKSISLGDIVFNNVQEGTDGSHTVDTIQIDKASGTRDKDGHFSLEGLKIENAYFSPLNTRFKYSQHIPYTQTTLKNINLVDKGKKVLSLQNLAINYPDYKQGGPIKYEVTTGSFIFDSGALPPAEAKSFSNLGYKKIEGQFNMSGSWNPITGDFDKTIFDISAKNVGTWRMNLQLQGMTEDFYEKLQVLSADKKIKESPMKLIGQIKLKSFKIRYEDASLTNRLLDQKSKEENRSRTTTIAALKASLSRFTEKDLKQSAFGKKLIAATGTFLDSPESLQFSINPAQPMSVIALAMTAVMAPGDFFDSANASIVANQ